LPTTFGKGVSAATMTTVPLTGDAPLTCRERAGPKGFHEGGEALPDSIKEFIAEDKILSEMGEVIAFSRWNDEYTKNYEMYKVGHEKFESWCVPCGCAGPGCGFMWLVFFPCTLAFAKLSTENLEEVMAEKAMQEGETYHIIFERHYVWMLDADASVGRSKPRVHKVCFLPGIDEAKPITNIDEHMRDGLYGICQDEMIPDLPGMLFKGQVVDGETFNSWQTEWVRTRGGGGYLHGKWEREKCDWQRRMVCEADKFSEALMAQKIKTEMNRPATAEMS